MSQSKRKPTKTKIKAAIATLEKHKLDPFGFFVVLFFALTAAVFEWTGIQALWDKTLPIPVFLEYNGIAFSVLGGLWTALGVRMTRTEAKAFNDLKGNPGLLSDALFGALHAASYFATWGTAFLMVGGLLLSGKVLFFHESATHDQPVTPHERKSEAPQH